MTRNTNSNNNDKSGGNNTKAPSPEICLEDHYAAAALIGLLSAQAEEPREAWARQWSLDIGEKMAREARQRRRRR